MKNLADLDWDTILDYLENGQAALLIGPGVMQFDGLPMNIAWRQSVWKTFQSKIAYNYNKEGFFLFANKIAKNNAANHVRKYLNERTPEETVYKKIVQIKFPLIVSINPDTYVSDVAYKFGVRHRFSYFKNRSKAVEDVEEPQKDLPLFYNLCGTINDDESIILDYEDLFRMIATSVSSPGLPPKLQAALGKVRMFFFIGFPFEKWYTQLLLRLLCGHEESEKYAINEQHMDDDVRDFLLNQFQIEFLEKGKSFLDALYDKCAERHLLRTLSDPASTEEINIIRLIQTGKDLSAALESLSKFAESTAYANDSTLLRATYHNLMEERRKGTLDSRDYFIQYNKIIDAILQIIHKPAP
jgi:Effector-associated domain 11/SIR2-like domain